MFVIGYPKSGNTWFCYLLAYCLNAEYDDFDDPGVHPRSEYERRYVKGKLAHRSWQRQTGRILKTHKLELGSTSDERIAYLVRDGRDVIVSYFHYLRNSFPDTFHRAINKSKLQRIYKLLSDCNDFSLFMRRFTPEWVTHVNQWLDKSPDAIIYYEDLTSCPAATLKKLFSTLQVEVDDSVIQQALEVFSFGNMAKGDDVEKRGGSFYRKGITGDWKNHFSLKDMNYFKTKAGDTMSRLGFTID